MKCPYLGKRVSMCICLDLIQGNEIKEFIILHILWFYYYPCYCYYAGELHLSFNIVCCTCLIKTKFMDYRKYMDAESKIRQSCTQQM